MLLNNYIWNSIIMVWSHASVNFILTIIQQSEEWVKKIILGCFGLFYLHLTENKKFKIMALQQGGLPVARAGNI